MVGKQFIATAALGLFLLAGCDDKSKTSSSSSTRADGTTSNSVVKTPTGDSGTTIPPDKQTGPTTRPTEPPHSTFQVADARTHQSLGYNFPRARLHIDRDEKTAILYSDDPKSAIDAKYGGNGYYMEIKLTDDALARLDGYQWHYRAASSEQQDSADGIFLEGQRYHLQPWDMTVTFNGEAPMVTVMLEGTFYEFDMNQSTREGTLVEVKGIISATVDAAK